MTITKKTVYITSDGTQFDTDVSANNYEVEKAKRQVFVEFLEKEDIQGKYFDPEEIAVIIMNHWEIKKK